jgi:hypothetical protein
MNDIDIISSEWVIVNHPIDNQEMEIIDYSSIKEKEYSVYDFFIAFIKKIIEL